LNPKDQTALDLLKARKFKFKRQMGQNFIFNRWILNQIADYADIRSGESVVEVGAGAGTLTEVLAERGAKVLAVELDRSLMPVLQTRLKEFGNVQLLQGDVMAMDLDQATRQMGLEWPYKIVSNLPYQISTPFLTMVFRQLKGVSEGVIMVQKEVALKVIAQPGTENYGMLSLGAAWFGQAEIVCELEPEYFTPAPPVDSAVLKIKRIPNKLGVEERALWTLIRGVMNQRRKNLLNGLKSLGGFVPRTGTTWSEVLEQAGISGQVRGETLSLDQFAAIVRMAGFAEEVQGLEA
jgi:16S rRNA (adenine1518-N6/adenine1519-N6)-dimethyltransferase